VPQPVSLDPASPPRPWSESDRLVPRAIVRPLRRFASAEAASGVAMLAMALIAMIWANSAWSESYLRFWSSAVAIEVGSLVSLELTVREWVNDLLMGVFFFVVALEIKRELVRGELADRRSATLPAVAALGGMVVPALIYAAINAGGDGSSGWGIPMATDIAFAIGVLSLLGRRIPASLVVFLLSLAIVDDLGAILVIAIFYTGSVSAVWLTVAVGSVVGALVLRRQDVRSLVPYALLAALCWFALHESGVHATLAGVAFGLLTPSRSFYDRSFFRVRVHSIVERVERADVSTNNNIPSEDQEAEEADALESLIDLATEVQPPLDRLEHRLIPWTSFIIVPLFALANAGVQLTGGELVDAFSEPVTLGVLLGLVVGKSVGVFLFAWAAVRLGVGKMPVGATWRQVGGVAMLAGVGFTVALFVTELAFGSGLLADHAKVGILAASLVAGVLGFAVLRLVSRAPHLPAHH
jgi:Na+:H+ antiporter, NhaA family